jgi:hypothetical protein
MSLLNDKLLEVAAAYKDVQAVYHDWALGEFDGWNDRDKIFKWLIKSIDESSEFVEWIDDIQSERLDLFSWQWNEVTVPVVDEVNPGAIAALRRAANEYLKASGASRIAPWTAWYRLFFIHPVIHELYYFDGHYKQDWDLPSDRMDDALRCNSGGVARVGWKACRKSLGTPRQESAFKACGSALFKTIHLFPWTSVINVHNILTTDIDSDSYLFNLRDDRSLTSKERSRVLAFAKSFGSMNVRRWIEYASCAINEGPMFVSRSDHSIEAGFYDASELLSSASVDKESIRATLKRHFKVTRYRRPSEP